MQNQKWMLVILTGIMVVALLAGCGSAEAPDVDPGNGVEEPVEEPEPEMTEEEQLALLQEERRELESRRKEELGAFYVPLPAIGEERERVTVEAKGLYVTSSVAGFTFDEENVEYFAEYIRRQTGQSSGAADTSRLGDINKLEQILGMCLASEINALVIDVKNDDGLVSWESEIAYVEEINSNWVIPMRHYERLMNYLKANDIYTIARIVVFKDPYLAKVRPDHAIQLSAGGTWRDRSGVAWVNPYDEDVWQYNIAVAQEAALRGFDEIQWDYVRFPDNARTYDPITHFPNKNDRPKDVGIEDFLIHSRQELAPYNVHIAADVFGVITRSWDDKPELIGQTWRRISRNTDYICPMLYPSHYGTNWYGFQYPDAHPYGVLRGALLEAIERNAAIEEPAVIRPWIQGFTASWVPGNIRYTPEVIAEQIIAGKELGINEYLIWSAGNNYDYRTFFYHDRIGDRGPAPGKDLIDRTPEEALRRFLSGQQHGRHHHVFLLTPIGDREAHYSDMEARLGQSELRLTRYTVGDIEQQSDGTYVALVDYRYESRDGIAEAEKGRFRIVTENDVFKVVPPTLRFEQPQEEQSD